MVHATAGDVGVDEAVREGRRAVELAEEGADDVFVAAFAGLAHALSRGISTRHGWRRHERSRTQTAPPMRWRSRCSPWSRSSADGLPLLQRIAGEGARDRRRNHQQPQLAAARMPPLRLEQCWRPRATSLRLSANSSTPSTSSATMSRRSTTPGCSSSLLMFAADGGASTKLTGRCGEPARSWPNLPTARASSGRSRTASSRQLADARGRARQGEALESPSDAELAVLRFLVTDLSTRLIAERLFLSPNTVRSHAAISRNLGLSTTRPSLRATALRLLEETQSPR